MQTLGLTNLSLGTQRIVDIIGSVTNLGREFTAGTTQTIDFSTEVPPESGPATYALTAYAGASLAGAILTVDTTTAAAGSITVRRTDSNGYRDYFVALTLTTTAGSYTAPNVSVSGIGADDGAATVYAFPISGGPRDGETVSITKAQIDALATNGSIGALTPSPVNLTTDADTDGNLDAGDIAEPGTAGVWVYRSGETPPAITTSLRDANGEIVASFTGAYTGLGTEATPIVQRESNGTAIMDSSGTQVDTSGVDVTDTFTTTQNPNQDLTTYTGQSGLSWTVRSATDAGQSIVIDPATSRLRAVQPLSGSREYYSRDTTPGVDSYAEALVRRGAKDGDTALQGQGIHLACALQPDNSGTGYVSLFLQNGQLWSLYRAVNGSLSQLATTPAGANWQNAGDQVLWGIQKVGSQISVLIDNVSVISLVDTAIASAGLPGLGANGGEPSGDLHEIINFKGGTS